MDSTKNKRGQCKGIAIVDFSLHYVNMHVKIIS